MRAALVARRLSILACWLAVGGLVAAIGYQNYYICFRATYFRIQEVQVTGVHALAAPAVQAMSGIELGDLFFEYDYDKVRARLLMAPRIQDAHVEVASPNIVRLAITEKTPVLAVTDAGVRYELDAGAAVLGKEQTVKTLPQVTGVHVASTPEGLALDPAQAELLSSCYWALTRSPLADFTAIDVVSPFKVSVLWHGKRVLMSDPANFDHNAPLVGRILSEARDRAREVEALDLRFNNVIVRFAPPPGAPGEKAKDSAAAGAAEAAAPAAGPGSKDQAAASTTPAGEAAGSATRSAAGPTAGEQPSAATGHSRPDQSASRGKPVAQASSAPSPTDTHPGAPAAGRAAGATAPSATASPAQDRHRAVASETATGAWAPATSDARPASAHTPGRGGYPDVSDEPGSPAPSPESSARASSPHAPSPVEGTRGTAPEPTELPRRHVQPHSRAPAPATDGTDETPLVGAPAGQDRARGRENEHEHERDTAGRRTPARPAAAPAPDASASPASDAPVVIDDETVDPDASESPAAAPPAAGKESPGPASPAAVPAVDGKDAPEPASPAAAGPPAGQEAPEPAASPDARREAPE